MWSGSGSEHTRSIIGLNFKGGPSVAPNLADAGTQGLGVKDDGGRFKAGGGPPSLLTTRTREELWSVERLRWGLMRNGEGLKYGYERGRN